MLDRFYLWLVLDVLPVKLVYFCGIRIWAAATTGPYGKSLVDDVSARESICRFCRLYAIPGHGKDEYYDSNRNVKRTQE